MCSFHIFDISSYVNNRGFTTEEDLKDGNLSLGKSSLPLSEIKLFDNFIFQGVPFCFTYNHDGDNIELNGQKITFETQKISKIHIIGNSSNGNLSGELVTYLDDAVVEKSKIVLTNFLETTPLEGNTAAKIFSYVHTPHGINYDDKGILWYQCIELEKKSSINSIIFEDNPFVHLFSITFESAL